MCRRRPEKDRKIPDCTRKPTSIDQSASQLSRLTSYVTCCYPKNGNSIRLRCAQDALATSMASTGATVAAKRAMALMRREPARSTHWRLRWQAPTRVGRGLRSSIRVGGLVGFDACTNPAVAGRAWASIVMRPRVDGRSARASSQRFRGRLRRHPSAAIPVSSSAELAGSGTATVVRIPLSAAVTDRTLVPSAFAI